MKRHVSFFLIRLCSMALLHVVLIDLAWALPSGVTDGTRAKRARQILQGRKLGLVIGINRYRDPHWYPLSYAVRDAVRFSKMMLRGGFLRKKTKILTSSQATTLSSIQKALRTLRSLNTSPYDTVVVYISAHGTVVKDGFAQKGKRYIITSNTDDERVVKTGLSVQWLREQLKQFPSRRKALILATCYTGKPKSKSRYPRGQKGGILVSPMPYSKTMLILNAASFRYSAYESKQLKSDVYTHFLLQCIERLRRSPNSRGRVSATQAHSCSVKETYEYVLRHRQVRQLPGLEADVTGLDVVYLFGNPPVGARRTQVVKRPASLSGKGGQAFVQIPHGLLQRYTIQFAGGSNKITTYAEPADLLTSFAPGRYIIFFRSKRTRKLRKVAMRLGVGQRVMLREPPAYVPHTVSMSLGYSRSGTSFVQADFFSLGLKYRRWLFAAGLRWEGFGKPSGTRFQLQRLSVRSELGLPLAFSSAWGVFVGVFASPGLVLRTSVGGEVSTGFFIQAGGTVDLDWRFHRMFGLRFGGDVGIDYTPTVQEPQGISLHIRVASAVYILF